MKAEIITLFELMFVAADDASETWVCSSCMAVFDGDDSAEIIVRDRARYSAIRTRLIEFFNLIACKDLKHRGIFKGSNMLFQLHNHSYRIKIKTLNVSK
ncbi:MAG: hypothetical protein PHV35_00995 [Mariniphaga sp.]|nr:hypothetical protein [Mariniphaga sp.]